MRDLTPEELKLAPDWATHYIIHEFGMPNHCVVFCSHNWRQWVSVESRAWSPKMKSQKVPLSAIPIPTKHFDITKHEFSDFSWSINEINYVEGYIDFYNHEACTDDGDYESHSVTKDDIIAIAKALCVTVEDLE